MTALVTAPAGASWAAPVRLDKDAAIDRAVRLGAALLLWLGLLVITYWWVADGGVTDLAHWVSGLTSLGRSDWSMGGRSAADPGAADVAATSAGARIRAGPIGPDPPGGRLTFVLPDDRPHRDDHRRLRLRRMVGSARDHLGADHRLRRRAARRRRDRLLDHGCRDQRQGRAAPAAVRVVAPAAPLCLSRRGAGTASPAVDRAGVSPLARRDGLLVDALGSRSCRDGGLADLAAVVAQPCGTACGSPRWSESPPTSCRST